MLYQILIHSAYFTKLQKALKQQTALNRYSVFLTKAIVRYTMHGYGFVHILHNYLTHSNRN